MLSLAINWNVDPVIFHIGSFGLRWYSLGFLIAFLLGYYILSYIFKREKVRPEYLEVLILYIFLAVLLGARLGHCIFYDADYFFTSEHWTEILWPFHNGQFTGFSGLASHGAAIGIFIALWLYWKKYRLNPWWICDRMAIVVALGGVFIRIGNLFNSEIYGIETDLPWGFVYERNGETVPKHPTQLYESLSYFVIFLVCLLVYRKKDGKLRPGALFGWWLIALFGVRLLIEFVKEEQVAFEQGMTLDMGQWLSIPFILLGVAFCIMAYKNKFNENIFLKKDEKIIKK